jgi:hypothetical protein
MMQILYRGLPEQLVFQGSVEAFFLALRLRVQRLAVHGKHIAAHQKHLEPGAPGRAMRAPRRAVVAKDGLGKPVFPEQEKKAVPDSFKTLIALCRYAKAETAHAVRHGQGMAAAAVPHREMTLEIGLPQIIGGIHLKPLPMRGGFARLFAYQTVAEEDGGDGLGRGNARFAAALQISLQLAPAPAGMLPAGSAISMIQ